MNKKIESEAKGDDTSDTANADSDADSALLLPGTLDIAAAEALHTSIKTALDGDGDLLVDAGDVDKLSSACAQIILAAALQLEADGRKLTIIKHSEVFSENFVLLGLENKFEQWSAHK